MKKIIFYNAHQHGDLLLSRQGVRWIIDHLGDSYEYFYLHNKNPESVFIHEKIEFLNLDMNIHSDPMHVYIKYFQSTGAITDEAIWVDTWFGSVKKVEYLHINETNTQMFVYPDENGKYYIDYNEKTKRNELFLCDLSKDYEKYKEAHDSSEMQKILFDEKISQINDLIENKIPYPDKKDLIVKYNSNPFYKKQADLLLDKINKFKNKVLVCNGDVISGQRKNFSYELIFKDLYDVYQDCAFLFTSKIDEVKEPNVFYIDDYLDLPNLDEIEYLSAFCNFIIHSASGPGCATMTDANFYDSTKHILFVAREDIDDFIDDYKGFYERCSDFSDESIIKYVISTLRELK
jgi:hypothetical protein